MRIVASVLIAGFVFARIDSSSAASTAEYSCEFYGSTSTSTTYTGLQDLLQSLPESSSVIVCKGKRNSEISILYPIENRTGVSFYRRSYFEVPTDRLSKATSAKDLLEGRHRSNLTMMAPDPSSKLTHQNEDIVRTRSISPGTFRTLYELWNAVIQDTRKLREVFDASSLDDKNNAQLENLIQSLNSGTETTIEYLEFEELRLADGDGIDLEFFPRLSVNISTKTQWWEIDYDVLDNERYTLLNVELSMELTGIE